MAKKQVKNKVKAKEFRRNNARTGHPAFIVKVYKDSKKNKKVEFIGITEAPKTHGTKNIRLDVNPEPNNTTKAHLRPKTEHVDLKEKTFGPNLTDWKFADSDKPKVKTIIEKSNKKRQHVGKSKR